ncbi:MAG TPA: neutral/alkaline non-lysosomal ceramidase N-terminal domain-containing protein [Ktedonobacteraceae bacterium]|nr:neutral/alkaline non-lysosomal ceramidase N-terminal domain-containing protein [Ktedonobacteraceae bacterium]
MATLQAGAARVVITPPIGVPLSGYFVAEGRKETAREVHDDLYARALVLRAGENTVAVVTTDLIALGDEELAMVRAEVQQKAGIAPEHLILACTHTHSGPIVHPFPPSEIVPGQADEAYFHLLPRLIGSAVAMAKRRLRPARIGAGKGASYININRREKLPDGTLRGLPFLGRNPDGIHDREVGVLRVDDAQSGKALAVLLSYACHPVVLGPNLEISADYVGYTVNFLEENLGSGTVALFANGAQGDMNAIVHPGTHEDAQRLGITLGAEALKVALSTETHPDASIATGTRRVELPLNPASAPEQQRAYIHFLQQEHARFTREGDTRRAWDIEMRLDVANYRLYNHERMRHPFMPAEITAFGIQGDNVSIGLVSEPAELFCEYGIKARQQSPFATTLVLGLANGFISYVPTPNVYTEGGYESEATQVAPGAGEQLCQTMIDALNAVA